MTEENKQKNQEQNLLSMEYVQKETEEVNRMEEYDLEDGLKVKFYPVFPGSKIQELVEEAQAIAGESVKLKVNFNDNQFNHHLLFLCIKHFTHLKDEIADDLSTQLQQFQYLVDTGVYETIVNDVFEQKEINKVFEKIADLRAQNEMLTRLENMTSERIEELDFVQRGLMRELEKSEKKYKNKTEKESNRK